MGVLLPVSMAICGKLNYSSPIPDLILLYQRSINNLHAKTTQLYEIYFSQHSFHPPQLRKKECVGTQPPLLAQGRPMWQAHSIPLDCLCYTQQHFLQLSDPEKKNKTLTPAVQHWNLYSSGNSRYCDKQLNPKVPGKELWATGLFFRLSAILKWLIVNLSSSLNVQLQHTKRLSPLTKSKGAVGQSSVAQIFLKWLLTTFTLSLSPLQFCLSQRTVIRRTTKTSPGSMPCSLPRFTQFHINQKHSTNANESTEKFNETQ